MSLVCIVRFTICALASAALAAIILPMLGYFSTLRSFALITEQISLLAAVVGILCRVLDQLGGLVAEWLACWTQAQKGPGSNRSCDAVG